MIVALTTRSDYLLQLHNPMFLVSPFLALTLAGAGQPPDPAPAPPLYEGRPPALEAQASLPPGSLLVGETYSATLIVQLSPDSEGRELSAAKAGVPGFLVQLDVPPSVELIGKAPGNLRELGKNNHLQEPFERMIDAFPAQIEFKLIGEPGPTETLGINLVGYLTPGEARKSNFVRKRLELPLTPGAASLEVKADKSNWGEDKKLLQIGSRASDFGVPRADGSELRLSHYLGEKNIIVTTYRAHW